MTLIELLSMNERIIVWSDAESNAIITWNQSCTLQYWFENPEASGDWLEFSVRTLSTEPKDFAAAREKARMLQWDDDR